MARASRGVNTARGVNKSRGVNASRGSKPNERNDYIGYLRTLKGRNKSIPLTPEQWKKRHGQ